MRHALALTVAAGVATLATIGWLGYRLLEQTRLPDADLPPSLISSAPLSPEQGQATVEAIMALTLPDLGGRLQALAQWRGKVLVVNYWASWCAPCVEEMPAFSRLQRQYAAQGVQFVGIALDSAELVRAFVEAHPVSYPLLIGGAAGIDLARQLGNGNLSLPYTLLITPQRELRLAHLGPLSEQELDLAVHQSLAR